MLMAWPFSECRKIRKTKLSISNCRGPLNWQLYQSMYDIACVTTLYWCVTWILSRFKVTQAWRETTAECRGLTRLVRAGYCKRCYFRVTKFSRLAAQKHIRGLLNSRWADAHLSFWYCTMCTMLTSFNEWYINMYTFVCNWAAQKQSRSQTDLSI